MGLCQASAATASHDLVGDCAVEDEKFCQSDIDVHFCGPEELRQLKSPQVCTQPGQVPIGQERDSPRWEGPEVGQEHNKCITRLLPENIIR